MNNLSATVPEPYRGRVTIFEILGETLPSVNAETRKEALTQLRRRARDRVCELRKQARAGATQRDGRPHALYAMLWVNAELALDALR